jgi:hypothetical protein
MGRSRSCQVYVDDMLVSRQHARLFVSSDSIFVEDYDSSNGVMVNESAIVGATRLHDGDRIILGTQEFIVRSTPAPSVGSMPAAQPVPAAAPAPSRTESSSRIAILTNKPTRPAPPVQALLEQAADDDDDYDSPAENDFDEPTLLTQKQDALSTMARLADRMMSLGRHEAAAKLLADHLRRLLAKLKEGKPVPPHLLEIAGLYAMKLADATRDGSWANLALESHMIARRPLPLKAIMLLEAQNRLPLFDRNLFASYKAVLRDVVPLLTPDERELADRIHRIAR